MFLFGPPNVKKLEAKRNLNGLIKALSYKKDNSVRKAAAEALGKIGWQPGTTEEQILYWIAKRQWDKCVEIGTPAVDQLIARLRDWKSEVREAAAEALEKLGWQPSTTEDEIFYWAAKGNSSK